MSVVVPNSPESEIVAVEIVSEPELKDMTLEIKLGTLTSYSGTMSFDLKIDGEGVGNIQVYAYDPKDMRKSGVFFRIGEAGLADLKGIVAKAEQTLEDLRRTKRYRKMIS